MYGFIYITTNTVNGMRYLGRCAYEKRVSWRTYLGSGVDLKRAIAQFGREAFTREIVAEFASLTELEAAERAYLQSHGCCESPEWYNIAARTGQTFGFEGKKHTAARNAAMAARLKGVKRPKHVVMALIKANTGRKRSEASVAKQRQTLLAHHHKRKPVVIDGIAYPSISAAVASGSISYHHARLQALKQEGTTQW